MVWAALDCPGGMSLPEMDGFFVLGRMTTRLVKPVRAGARYVVMARYLRSEGRKHFATTAIYSETGEFCGGASQIWFMIQEFATA